MRYNKKKIYSPLEFAGDFFAKIKTFYSIVNYAKHRFAFEKVAKAHILRYILNFLSRITICISEKGDFYSNRNGFLSGFDVECIFDLKKCDFYSGIIIIGRFDYSRKQC